jgi:hypothetical protein
MATNDKQKAPNFEDAVAKDWYAGIQNDLSKMSQGQLDVTQKALADFVAKKSDHSEADFNKKVSRMTARELEEMMRDGDEAARRKNG